VKVELEKRIREAAEAEALSQESSTVSGSL
jgi:hypothetical protein